MLPWRVTSGDCVETWFVSSEQSVNNIYTYSVGLGQVFDCEIETVCSTLASYVCMCAAKYGGDVYRQFFSDCTSSVGRSLCVEDDPIL